VSLNKYQQCFKKQHILFISAVTPGPDRIGYLPVRKAALLGVQSGAAAMCWVSFTPSRASLSMLGVLQARTTTTQQSH